MRQCSLVAYDETSVITVNNSGYNNIIEFHQSVDNKNMDPGISRIDMFKDIISGTALPIYSVTDENKVWTIMGINGYNGEIREGDIV